MRIGRYWRREKVILLFIIFIKEMSFSTVYWVCASIRLTVYLQSLIRPTIKSWRKWNIYQLICFQNRKLIWRTLKGRKWRYCWVNYAKRRSYFIRFMFVKISQDTEVVGTISFNLSLRLLCLTFILKIFLNELAKRLKLLWRN